MPNLDGAYQLAIKLCNSTNPYCRYSQASGKRSGEIKEGYQWFDCSGFIWYVLNKNGFSVKNYSFTTLTEVSVLTEAGFQEVDINGQWLEGDIVWKRTETSGHTEMVYRGGIGKGITMGAHTSKSAIAKQVSINNSYSTKSSYMKLLRYGGGVTPPEPREWIYRIGERQYLTDAEKENNAILVYRGLSNYDFTLESICGILGNMEAESDINPGLKTGDAWGLTQFYPSSRLTVWSAEKGYNWYDGDAQLELINEEGYYTDPSKVTWLPTASYKYTWDEFKALTDPQEAAKAYLYENERPGSPNPEFRATLAQKWYDFLQNVDPGGGGGEGSSTKPLPLWFMLRRI